MKKTSFVGKRTGKTLFKFVMTEQEFHHFNENSGGLCVSCGEESLGGVEPDAERYDCEACDKPTLYGVAQLLIVGFVSIGDESEERAS